MKNFSAIVIIFAIFSTLYAEEPCYYYGKKLTCLEKIHVEFSVESNSYVKSVLVGPSLSLQLTGEIGVVFKKGISRATINEVKKKYSFKVARTIDGMDSYYVFTAPADSALFEISRNLFESGLVKWAQPVWLDFPMLASIPNDTYYIDQWQHKVINSENAWDAAKGNADVKIAVVDSGVDTKHQDLFLQPGMSFVPGEPQIDPNMGAFQNKYFMAHGTAVSGIAAGQGDNGFGISGVCPKCSVIPIKYIGLEMSNPPADRKLNAIKWAVDAGAWIINNSWTIASDKDAQTEQCLQIPLDNFVNELIDYAVQFGRNGLGTVIVWAAGNSTCDTVMNPSLNDERIVVVSGLDIDSSLVYYSNYGINIDIAAPAGDSMPGKSGLITTDVSTKGKGFNPAFNDANTEYSDYPDQAYTKYFDGTSAAAPVVAGALALMLSANPAMTYAEAIDCMKKAASVPDADCSYGDKSVCFGAGILDVGKMVEMAISGECGGEITETDDKEQIPDESAGENDNFVEVPDDKDISEKPDQKEQIPDIEKSDENIISEKNDVDTVIQEDNSACSIIVL